MSREWLLGLRDLNSTASKSFTTSKRSQTLYTFQGFSRIFEDFQGFSSVSSLIFHFFSTVFLDPSCFPAVGRTRPASR